ncbi:replication endonuclease [Cronobacter sakazakii]|nr:replication endonuclease [Cronobacter sakazakii]
MPECLHAWNAPREAIASPYLTYEQERRRADELERAHDVQRANAFLVNFTRRALPRLELVAAKYRIEAISPDVALPVFDGRDDDVSARYLTTRLVNMTARYNRLADMSKADIDLLAGDIANFIIAELGTVEIQEGSELKALHASYMCAARITRHFKNAPPLWEKITTKYVTAEDVGPAVLRMATEKWWTGRLRRVAAEWREHLHIALGNVSKKHSAYASKSCVSDWREQKRRTREFLKGMELEDEVTGERISLINKYDGSVANPAIRRCELMNRIRGFENICNELGYVGEFYTLTAPSKFHATTKAGYRNTKWNGASPADTQRYLTGLWARIRAKLHRDDIRIFGIRVAEPHHDATPHWHMLMFMLPEDVERVRAVITRYAREEDHHELKSEKARKARFHAEPIDPDKGSATGYVAKYISKNIDGYALDDERDDESGEMLKETAPAVSAWAARWHIRQFQFVGGAPVTVYRELRRMADAETAKGLSVEFALVHDAADAGDWAGYVNAQGGPFVRRDELQVRTWYESTDTVNDYGEECVRIRGVYDTEVGDDTPIVTRLTQWKIVPKRPQAEGFEVKGAPAPSRSSVNNCTPEAGPDPAERPPVDLTRPLTRRERRQLTDRLRKRKAVKRRTFNHATEKNAAGIARTIDEIHLLTGETLSRGQALSLMSGAKMCINGKWCRGSGSGEIFAARMPKPVLREAQYKARAERVLAKFNAIRAVG